MAGNETSAEIMAKIILDEANLAFCETTERQDEPGKRNPEGSCWDQGKMEGEYDEDDFQKILELQAKAATVCDDHPELEDLTAEIFKSITSENAEEVLKKMSGNKEILELGRVSVTVFLLRFPSPESFINKGHPLVMASDDYMLQNSDTQNWYDFKNIADEFGWV
jgi:hypothetical protein|tara:strand:- start:74 stop:568 length:495 start_codon:yes stop_codon:yes gene_type:complete